MVSESEEESSLGIDFPLLCPEAMAVARKEEGAG